MPVVPIGSVADPRLAVYRHLKDHELDRAGRLFIAEGLFVVERLLATDYPVESLLVAESWLERVQALTPPEVPVYVAPTPVLHEIVGFPFHRGVLACGRRKPSPTFEQVLGGSREPADPATLVVCPAIEYTENLGSLIRVCAAFGVTALVLGPRCCDPWYRRAIRVSMGTVFRLPIVRSEDLEADLKRLRRDFGVELAATVLAPAAEPLDQAKRPPRLALLLGREADGLEQHWIDLCDRRITIPMKMGTDSLNVAVAAAVFLYHFTRSVRCGDVAMW